MAESPFVLAAGNVIIASGTELTIEPGVQVYFAGHYRITINGTLRALGADGDSIRFTTDLAANPAGWAGLRFVNAHDSSRLDHCILEFGRAAGAGWSDSTGGALFLSGTHRRLSVSHSTFRHNRAPTSGGAAYLGMNTRPSFTDCRFEDNQALGGGALYLHRTDSLWIARCEFVGNSASSNGGAFFSYYGRGLLTECDFTGNSSGVAGGAVRASGSVRFVECDFEGNWSQSDGGAMYLNDSTSTCRFEQCDIINNHANVRAGAIYCWESSPYFLDCRIEGNWAPDRGGGVNVYRWGARPTFDNCLIRGNHTNVHGGGVWCGTYSRPRFINGTRIVANTSIDGGGLCAINRAYPLLEDCVIDSNVAAGNGGGVYAEQFAAVTMNRTVLAANSAAGSGGGFCGYSGFFAMDACSVRGNSAEEGGGMAVLQTCGGSGSAVARECVITGNTATDGAGLFLETGTCAEFDRLVISGNTAAERGGGISCLSDAAPVISRSTIAHNSAPQGAGLYIATAAPTLTSCIVAYSTGDGLCFASASGSSVRYCELYDNSGGHVAGSGCPAGLGIVSTVNPQGNPSDSYYNIFLSPQFLNDEAGDYRLGAESPAVDAGDPMLSCDPDLTLSDIGAKYRAQPVSLPAPHSLVASSRGTDLILAWNSGLVCAPPPDLRYHIYEATNGGSDLRASVSDTTVTLSSEMTGSDSVGLYYVVGELNEP